MDLRDIRRIRLQLQQLTSGSFTEPASLLSWFGAMQAQHYEGSKWAMGVRVPGITEEAIEQAISSGLIIRTWGLRGTLHFYAKEDLGWIRRLIFPRVENLHVSQIRGLGMDRALLKKSHRCLERILQGSQPVTRKDLKASLDRMKIPIHDLRFNFILWKAAIDGLICLGPKRGKEFTYTLVEEWAPDPGKRNHDEALRELTLRYFSSRGPATPQDFAWWSGLTLSEINKGLDMLGNQLQKTVCQGQSFWMSREISLTKISGSSIFLLPSFDEYLVGYRDRSLLVDSDSLLPLIITRNGIFNPTMLVQGKVVGLWKQMIGNDRLMIEPRIFTDFKKSWRLPLSKCMKQLGKFHRIEISPISS